MISASSSLSADRAPYSDPRNDSAYRAAFRHFMHRVFGNSRPGDWPPASKDCTRARRYVVAISQKALCSGRFEELGREWLPLVDEWASRGDGVPFTCPPVDLPDSPSKPRKEWSPPAFLSAARSPDAKPRQAGEFKKALAAAEQVLARFPEPTVHELTDPRTAYAADVRAASKCAAVEVAASRLIASGARTREILQAFQAASEACGGFYVPDDCRASDGAVVLDLIDIVNAAERTMPAAEPACVEVVEDDDEPRSDGDPGPFPADLLDVPGFVGDVVRFNLETAFRPIPSLALAGALALQSVLCARRVRTATGVRPNCYFIAIANSGDGKDHARSVNRKILVQAGLDDFESPQNVTSDAAIATLLHKNPALLWQQDEMGRFLATTTSASKNPHLHNVVTMLCELFTSIGGVWKHKAYADSTRNIAVNQPSLSLFGTSTPGQFYDSIDASSIENGLLSRCFIVEPSESPAKRRPVERDVPDPIIEVARAWGAFTPGGDKLFIGEHPVPAVVELTKGAESVREQFDDHGWEVERSRAIRAGNQPAASLLSRAGQKAETLALLYACSVAGPRLGSGELLPVIDVAAMTWGCRVADHLTRRLLFLAETRVGGSQFDLDCKRVVRIVQESGRGGVSLRDLYRKLHEPKKRPRNSFRSLSRLNGSGVRRFPTGRKLQPTSGFSSSRVP